MRSIFCADVVLVPAQLHYLHVKCSRRAVSGLAQQNKTAGDCSRFKPSVIAHPPLYARLPLFCFSICSFIIKCLGISEGYDFARIASCASFFFPPLIGFLLLCQEELGHHKHWHVLKRSNWKQTKGNIWISTSGKHKGQHLKWRASKMWSSYSTGRNSLCACWVNEIR